MNSNGDVILSTEYLFSINQKEYTKNVFDFFSKIFSRLYVYIYVRNPGNYYKSWQQQSITTRSYVESPYKFKYDFRGAIEAWSEYFEVKVVKFSKEKSSLDSFLNGLNLDKNVFDTLHERENVSMSIEQMMLLQELNSYVFPDSNDILHGKIHLKKILSKKYSGFEAPILKKEVYDYVNLNHLNDLEWLKRNHGIEFKITFLDKNNLSDMDSWRVEDIYENFDQERFQKYKFGLLNHLLMRL
jgi:hypothetical protein